MLASGTAGAAPGAGPAPDVCSKVQQMFYTAATCKGYDGYPGGLAELRVCRGSGKDAALLMTDATGEDRFVMQTDYRKEDGAYKLIAGAISLSLPAKPGVGVPFEAVLIVPNLNAAPDSIPVVCTLAK